MMWRSVHVRMTAAGNRPCLPPKGSPFNTEQRVICCEQQREGPPVRGLLRPGGQREARPALVAARLLPHHVGGAVPLLPRRPPAAHAHDTASLLMLVSP